MKGFWSIFAKITIPAVLIYIVILLVFQSCSTGAAEETNSYRRNCFTPADVLPPSKDDDAKEPAGAPKWNNVHSAKEFWTAVHDQPKNVVLFGTEYCTWCRATEKWWKENGAVDGWQFVDWNYMDNDGEKAWKEFLKTVKDVYYTRNPKDSEVGFPTCAVIVNAQPGKPLAESVVYAALGFDECSRLMKEFILSLK